ncbi:TPA: hypothetical protein DEB00_00900 [Candidatus Uhrbacteria bacterium]|nr:hypothetical protein [Candidatus Uhrbacteria bacterium]
MNRSFLQLSAVLSILVLAGAGCFGGNTASDQFSVWKSVDGGANWQKQAALPTPEGVGDITSVEVNELVFDPSDHFALYMGSVENGLLYSYDGGEGWNRVREPMLRDGRVRAIAVDPQDKCTVYVSRGQRLLKTEDCGRTFNTEMYVDPRSDVVITDVEVDWFNSNVVYLTNTAGEVLKSTDAGVNWVTAYNKGGFNRDIEIDNRDSRILLLSTAQSGLRRSIDGGATWVNLFADEPYKDLDGVKNVREVVQTAAGDTYWVSTDYGLLTSTDRGETWNPVPLLAAGSDISALAVDPKDGMHVMYVAGSTIYTSVNSGARWDPEKMPAASRGYQLIIDPENDMTVYLGLRAIEEQSGLIF